MGLLADVRAHAAAVTAAARHVTIDHARLAAYDPGEAPGLDPDVAWLAGDAEAVARWILVSDAVNFGSGWFPTLRKAQGRSGSETISLALREHAAARGGPWTAAELRELDAAAVAGVLGQDADHELMALYATALRDLGAWLGDDTALDRIAEAGDSAERLAEQLAAAMPLFRDPGFYKRAQITANDLALAGVATFADLDDLTMFADNLVPHVLRVDGVLRYDPALAARIDAGELIPAGAPGEVEIRAAGLQVCELVAARTGIPPRLVDGALWNRGQLPRYKAVPRHRTRTTSY